jgi:hypothetical protein
VEHNRALTTEAQPAVSAPPAAVADAVYTIAAADYDLDQWSAAADTIAPALAPISPVEILAAAVHPPPGPEYLTPWDWRFRVQVGATVLAARRAPDAFATLCALINGPVDWTTTAGIVALLDLARRGRVDANAAASELLRAARLPITPIWFGCGFVPALLALLDVPGLDNAMYAFAAGALQKVSDES